jgi:hypothetical protein
MPLRHPIRPLLLAALGLLAATLPSTRALAQCSPAACAASHAFLDFESLAPGTPVEGPGAVHPDLVIASVAWPFGPTCTLGSAAANASVSVWKPSRNEKLVAVPLGRSALRRRSRAPRIAPRIRLP